MIDFLKKSISLAFFIVTIVFTFVPESFFEGNEWLNIELLEQCNYYSCFDAHDVNVIISRLVCFVLVWIVTALIYLVFLILRRNVTIKGQNYLIRVEYGDIHKKKDCKRVINFDECFTTQIGNATADINVPLEHQEQIYYVQHTSI